jgi:NADH-quinone oxidoreductase subunit N
MVISGIGFKLSLVPFHMWTPDVYQGAPTPVTGYLATVSKGAVFVALTRMYLDGQLYQYPSLINALVVIAIASMLIGNLLALRQNNIKRLLAYSSIAHLGYLLVVLIALTGKGLASDAVTYYLTAYVLTSLAAFAVIARVSGEEVKQCQISAYEGLFWRDKVQALCLTVALLSLAGIPLTAGFIGKFYVITVGVQSSLWALLAAVVVGSAIAIYYYLRIIFAMSKVPADTVEHQAYPGRVLALFLTLLVLVLGSWPEPFINYATSL